MGVLKASGWGSLAPELLCHRAPAYLSEGVAAAVGPCQSQVGSAPINSSARLTEAP
jgi:hypothetical protein